MSLEELVTSKKFKKKIVSPGCRPGPPALAHPNLRAL